MTSIPIAAARRTPDGPAEPLSAAAQRLRERAWLAQRVADGPIRWVLTDGGSDGMPNDGRGG